MCNRLLERFKVRVPTFYRGKKLYKNQKGSGGAKLRTRRRSVEADLTLEQKSKLEEVARAHALETRKSQENAESASPTSGTPLCQPSVQAGGTLPASITAAAASSKAC